MKKNSSSFEKPKNSSSFEKPKNSSKSFKDRQKGGGSHPGPDRSDNSVLGMLAKYWYFTLGKQVWWSDNQPGYYFTNLMNNYQSRVHMHVIDGNIDRRGLVFTYVVTCYGYHPYEGEVIAKDLSNASDQITQINSHLFQKC